MRPPAPTRVGLAVDALLAALRAAAPDIGLRSDAVVDGPWPGEVTGDGLTVGWSDGDSEAVLVTREARPGLGRAYIETLTVVCVAWSWAGDVPMKPRRDRCVQILELVADTLKANPTLGGVVEQAHLGRDMSWVQQQASGARCHVGFPITLQTSI